MTKDHVARLDNLERYDLSGSVGTKKLSISFTSRGTDVWFAFRVQTRYRVVAHPSRPWPPLKGGSASVRKWQMVLRSTILSAKNRAKTEMSGEAVSHV